MANRVRYAHGVVAAVLGTSAPNLVSNAKEVYGSPDVRAVTQMLESTAFTPQGERPDTAGKTTGELVGVEIRFPEFTVPSSGGERPQYHEWLVISGHKPPSAIVNRTSAFNEDTGLRGDGVTTTFRFLTKYAPGSIVHVTDGTQTVTGSAGAWTTGGTGSYDVTTGLVTVTFATAPAADATITVRYTGGYSLSYDHSRYPQSLQTGYIILTKHRADGADEEKRTISGARGVLEIGLTTGDVIKGDLSAVGKYHQRAMTGAAPVEPVFEDVDDLVWDDTCTVVLYEVKTGGDGKEYVGIIPSITLSPGFESEEPRGAVTIGYTVQGALKAGRSTLQLDLQPLICSELNLEEARRTGKQFQFRAVIPGRESPDNKLVFTARLQPIELGEAQDGFGGDEQVQTTWLIVAPGNALTPSASLSEPRYRFEVTTT